MAKKKVQVSTQADFRFTPTSAQIPRNTEPAVAEGVCSKPTPQ